MAHLTVSLALADDPQIPALAIAKRGEEAMERAEENGDPTTRKHLRETYHRARATEINAATSKNYNLDLGASAIREFRFRKPNASPEKLAQMAGWVVSVYDSGEKHISEEKLREWEKITGGLFDFAVAAAGRGKGPQRKPVKPPGGDSIIGLYKALTSQAKRGDAELNGWATVRQYGFEPTRRRLNTSEWAQLIRAGEKDPVLGRALDLLIGDLNNAPLYSDYEQFKRRNPEAFERIEAEDARKSSEVARIKNEPPRRRASPVVPPPNPEQLQLAERSFNLQIAGLERFADKGSAAERAAARRHVTALQAYRKAAESGDKAKIEKAHSEVNLAQVNLQVVQGEAHEANLDKQDRIDNVNMGVDAVDALARLIGLSNPEAARALSAGSKLLGTVATNIITFNPLSLGNAIVNFFSAIFGGPSDLELILKAIADLRKDVQQMREEMHSLFLFTNQNMERMFAQSLDTVLSEFDRMDKRLTSEFSKIQGMNQKTHALLGDILTEMVASNRRSAIESADQTKSRVRNQFSDIFNKRLAPSATLDQAEFERVVKDIVRCAEGETGNAYSFDIGGASIDDLREPQLDALFVKMGRGALRSDRRLGSLELLHVINQIYGKLDRPLTQSADGKQRLDIPNGILWSYCADLYLKTQGATTHEKIREWLSTYEGWKDETPGGVATSIAQAGNVVRGALQELLYNPSHVHAAHDQARIQLDKFARAIRRDYRAVVPEADVHAGPYQQTTHAPEFKVKGRAVIPICPDYGTVHKDVAKQPSNFELNLEESGDAVDAFIHALPPEMRNAEALGMGKLSICILAMWWVRDPKENSYSTHYGTMYDWRQHRHGNFNMTFSVRLGEREIQRLGYRHAKTAFYERRTYYHDADLLKKFLVNHVSKNHAAKDIASVLGPNWSQALFALAAHPVKFKERVVIPLKVDDAEMMRQLFTGSSEFDLEVLAPQMHIHDSVSITDWVNVEHFLEKERSEIVKALPEQIRQQRRFDTIENYNANRTKEPEKFVRVEFQPEVMQAAILGESWFLKALRGEMNSFYPTLTMEDEEGLPIEGLALQKATDAHYAEVRERLSALIDSKFASAEGAEPSEKAKFKDELMTLADQFYRGRLFPQLEEQKRVDFVRRAETRAQRSRLSGMQPFHPYLSAVKRVGLPAELQKVFVDFEVLLGQEYDQFYANWRKEYEAAMGPDNQTGPVPAAAAFPRERVSADRLHEEADTRFKASVVRIEKFLTDRLAVLSPGVKASEAAKTLQEQLLAVHADVYNELLRPAERTEKVAVMVERKLRDRARDAEEQLRRSIGDENGGADMKYTEPLAALSGVTELINVTEELATGKPSPKVDLENVIKAPGLIQSLLENDESTLFNTGMWDTQDIVALIQLYKLPLYSASGPDLLEWWEKNIDANERRLLDRLEERRANDPEFAVEPTLMDLQELADRQRGLK